MRWCIALLMGISVATMADETSCPVASYQDGSGSAAYLWQQSFDDGAQDLVMSLAKPDIQSAKRVTFGGSHEPGCHYLALAIARGGDWGWHIAWSNQHGVFYARMDGEAWVSSPPKKISSHAAKKLGFEQDATKLILRWQPLDASPPAYAISDDEGRSW